MSRIGPGDASVMRRLDRALPALYGLRSVVTLGWIGVVLLTEPSPAAGGPVPGFRVLVALYPIIDAVASAVDVRVDTTWISRVAHGVEAVLGLVAAAWLLLIASGWHSIIVVVGTWGVATGLIQLLVAARRVGFVRGQWFMIVSGAGSVVAGASFVGWSGSAHAFVALVSQYATGGVIWYVVAATWSLLLRPTPGSRSPAVP
jgi:hypothetical protein